MAIHFLSADHRHLGLDTVARLGAVAPHLGPDLLAAPLGLRGALVLSTCNRLALLLDTGEADGADPTVDSTADPGAAPAAAPATTAVAQPGSRGERGGLGGREAGALSPAAPGPAASPRLDEAVVALLTQRAGLPADHLRLAHWQGRDAHRELFATACGLRSMVVGERQIAGQLRRAQRAAAAEGTLSTPIIRAVERASIVSRRVSAETALAGRGRSVVAVGLELAGRHLPAAQQCRVIIVGTGSYAGATVSALRDRGVSRIGVYSTTDRARAFAQERGLQAVEPGGLGEALTRADLVITCRGLGAPVLTAELMGSLGLEGRERDLVVLDLALTRDVEPDVASLPGIVHLDLDHVQAAVPQAATGEVDSAWRVVEEETADFERSLAGRRMDALIADLRSQAARAVAEESARLRPLPAGSHLPGPATAAEAPAGAGEAHAAAADSARAQGGGGEPVVTLAQAERALHRLAARLMHQPTVAARRAGQTGQQEAYREALALVIGTGLESGDTDKKLVRHERHD